MCSNFRLYFFNFSKKILVSEEEKGGGGIMFHEVTVPSIILWDFHITDQEIEICQQDRRMQDKN